MQREIYITAIRNGDSHPLKLMWAKDEYIAMTPSDKKGFWRPWHNRSFKNYHDFEKYMNGMGYHVKEKANAKKNITD